MTLYLHQKNLQISWVDKSGFISGNHFRSVIFDPINRTGMYLNQFDWENNWQIKRANALRTFLLYRKIRWYKMYVVHHRVWCKITKSFCTLDTTRLEQMNCCMHLRVKVGKIVWEDRWTNRHSILFLLAS